MLLERGLDGVMHFGIGVHRALALDPRPGRLGMGTERAAGGRRVAQQTAGIAALQVEVVRRAVLEVLEVLDVEIVDLERHAEIGRADGHGAILPQAPRRMTIAEPVPGIAQPRLALTSTFFTWRQPPGL